MTDKGLYGHLGGLVCIKLLSVDSGKHVQYFGELLYQGLILERSETCLTCLAVSRLHLTWQLRWHQTVTQRYFSRGWVKASVMRCDRGHVKETAFAKMDEPSSAGRRAGRAKPRVSDITKMQIQIALNCNAGCKRATNVRGFAVSRKGDRREQGLAPVTWMWPSKPPLTSRRSGAAVSAYALRARGFRCGREQSQLRHV